MPEFKLLALECSTDTWSVAACVGRDVRRESGTGGAQASAQLIPTAMRLLRSLHLRVADLDAIAFGQGPGAFTGLRTACAVAQGLAFAAGVPVLPINTLLAVAQAASAGTDGALVLSVQDARMGEVYTVLCQRQDARWSTWDPEVWPARVPCQGRAMDPALLAQSPWLPLALESGLVLAGNAWEAHAAVLPSGPFVRPLIPSANSLLELAPSLLSQGQSVAAPLAQPLYVRNKVAQTTTERLAAKAMGQA